MKKSIVALVLESIKYLFVCLSPAAVRGLLLGAVYDYNFRDKVNGVYNIGIGGSLGYEYRNRYVVISWIWIVSDLSKKGIGTDRYTSDKIHWKAGGEVGYITPINFDISIGAGDIYEKEYICMVLGLRVGCSRNVYISGLFRKYNSFLTVIT